MFTLIGWNGCVEVKGSGMLNTAGLFIVHVNLGLGLDFVRLIA